MKWIKYLLAVIALSFLTEIHSEAGARYDAPNGENGYYVSIPQVLIEHEGIGITKYRIKNMSGTVKEEPVIIGASYLEEGTNYLDIWTEDEAGRVVEGSMKQIRFLIDLTPPEYPLQFRYQDVLEITANDRHSGIAGIFYSVGNQEFQYVEGTQVFCSLPEGFSGQVCAYAVDRAGNRGEYCYFEKKSLEKKTERKDPEVDTETPIIEVSGIVDFQIEKEPIELTCKVTDNVEITEVQGILSWIDIHGNKKSEEMTEWEKIENGYVLQRRIDEDGIYQLWIEGMDKAGNKKKIQKHILYDSMPPIIQPIVEPTESVSITDLTSCTYEIRIDGILYDQKEPFEEPGHHVLEITAKDLLGNETKHRMNYYVEKPEKEEAKGHGKIELLIVGGFILLVINKLHYLFTASIKM